MPALRAHGVRFIVGFIAILALIPALVWAVEHTLVGAKHRDPAAATASDPGASAEPLVPAPDRVKPFAAPEGPSTACPRGGGKCRAGRDRKRHPVRHARIELATRPDRGETGATGEVTPAPAPVHVHQPQIAAAVERDRLLPNQRTTDVTGVIEDALEDPVGETVERVDDVAAPVITLVEGAGETTDLPVDIELPSQAELPIELPLPTEPDATLPDEDDEDGTSIRELELSPHAARILSELAERGVKLRIRLVDTTR